MMNSEKSLVRRLKSQEPAAFAELLDLYGERVQRLARRYTACSSDTEDLTQEIFLDLFKCAGAFRGESSLGTWVYRVALNHCLRFKERAGRLPDQLPEAYESADPHTAAHPEQSAVRRELSVQVEQALGRLTPPHRDVVILHELHQLTYQECALILQIPVGTVKSRLSNAFSALRASLGPYVLGEGQFNLGSASAPAKLAEAQGGTS